MSRYINSFQNITSFMTAISSSALSEPYVAYNENAKKLYFNVDYTHKYLTIVSLSDNNIIRWKGNYADGFKKISVSTDNGSTWVDVTSNNTTDGATLATLNTGDKLLIKGSNNTYGISEFYYNWFRSTGKVNIEGNIMSLIYGDNFIGQTTLSTNYTFNMLLYGLRMVDVSNLILPATTLTKGCYRNMFYSRAITSVPELPATTLAENCYEGMFYGCTSLVNGPKLPATTLTEGCYLSMFKNCSSLTTAPELPATTLAENCYEGMFNNCISLTTAPELPATTLVYACYKELFYGCNALNYIKCLATDISATDCTSSWVSGVSATGTFVKDANMTSWNIYTSGIPSGWTVQNA